MRDARRELADHRQFAGLDQFVLGFAQGPFGARPDEHLILQLLVGLGQVGGAFLDLAFQFVIGFLQRFARREALTQVAPSVVEKNAQHPEQQSAHPSHRGPNPAHLADLLDMRKHGK